MTSLRSGADPSANVLVVGDWAASEFAAVMAELASRANVAVAKHAVPVDCDESFDLIVVLQRWPEEYSPRQVLAILDGQPLARLVVCCGPWCDSDGRSRSVWPPASRVRAEFSATRVNRELAVIGGQSSPLPLTANRDEAYLFDHECFCDVTEDVETDQRLTIAIKTADPEIHAWLRVTLEPEGHTVHTSLAADADVLVWDVDPWTPQMLVFLAAKHETDPATLIVALAGYSRPHEEVEMRQAGVHAVVAKLASRDELLRVVSDAAMPRKVLREPHAVPFPMSASEV